MIDKKNNDEKVVESEELSKEAIEKYNEFINVSSTMMNFMFDRIQNRTPRPTKVEVCEKLSFKEDGKAFVKMDNTEHSLFLLPPLHYGLVSNKVSFSGFIADSPLSEFKDDTKRIYIDRHDFWYVLFEDEDLDISDKSVSEVSFGYDSPAYLSSISHEYDKKGGKIIQKTVVTPDIILCSDSNYPFFEIMKDFQIRGKGYFYKADGSANEFKLNELQIKWTPSLEELIDEKCSDKDLSLERILATDEEWIRYTN